ncbi:hypothetical protein [Streptomyces yangpuensis]|uniref:hypothetical protein n=1 Tax=Streptomyces yangpuensis TaxID=1648182 RepID=UPI0036CB7A93
MASRHHDGTVVVRDLQTEAPARVMNVGEEGDALRFSADGHWLAVTVKDRVYVYNTWGARVRDLSARPGKESRTWQRMAGAVGSVPSPSRRATGTSSSRPGTAWCGNWTCRDTRWPPGGIRCP